MRKRGQPPVIHCVFAEKGERPAELVLQSFQIYLRKRLGRAANGKPASARGGGV